MNGDLPDDKYSKDKKFYFKNNGSLKTDDSSGNSLTNTK